MLLESGGIDSVVQSWFLHRCCSAHHAVSDRPLPAPRVINVQYLGRRCNRFRSRSFVVLVFPHGDVPGFDQEAAFSIGATSEPCEFRYSSGQPTPYFEPFSTVQYAQETLPPLHPFDGGAMGLRCRVPTANGSLADTILFRSVEGVNLDSQGNSTVLGLGEKSLLPPSPP